MATGEVLINNLPDIGSMEPDDELIVGRDGLAYKGNIGALSEANEANIGDGFSEAKAYSAGDYCIYNDVLYKFTSDKEAGAWDAGAAEKTSVGAELSALNTELSIKDISGEVSMTAGTLRYAYYKSGWVILCCYVQTTSVDTLQLGTINAPYRPLLVSRGYMNANGTVHDAGKFALANMQPSGTFSVRTSEALNAEEDFVYIYPTA